MGNGLNDCGRGGPEVLNKGGLEEEVGGAGLHSEERLTDEVEPHRAGGDGELEGNGRLGGSRRLGGAWALGGA